MQSIIDAPWRLGLRLFTWKSHRLIWPNRIG